MKLEPVFQTSRRPLAPPRPAPPSPPSGPDQVLLSSTAYEPLGKKPASGPAKTGWLASLHNIFQQLSGPVGPVVKTALDVWMGARRHSQFESVRDFASPEAALRQFEKSRARLLNPNEWKALGPGLAAADFKLYCDDRRQPKQAPAEVGDYLKIRLPDLGPKVWCRIEKLENKGDHFELVVRPSPDPRENDPSVAHFFSEHTTNHFQLSRNGQRVISRVVGREEALNRTGGWGDLMFSALRLKGAWLGAKQPQWRSFTRKLLED